MLNCNPETVSTDYDTSSRLYFEPLTVEDVLNVIEVRILHFLRAICDHPARHGLWPALLCVVNSERINKSVPCMPSVSS